VIIDDQHLKRHPPIVPLRVSGKSLNFTALQGFP
jgi:hypothetical protein